MSWCPVNVDALPTGDGIACGQFATVRLIDPDGEEMWICADCARTPILFARPSRARRDGAPGDADAPR